MCSVSWQDWSDIYKTVVIWRCNWLSLFYGIWNFCYQIMNYYKFNSYSEENFWPSHMSDECFAYLQNLSFFERSGRGGSWISHWEYRTYLSMKIPVAAEPFQINSLDDERTRAVRGNPQMVLFHFSLLSFFLQRYILHTHTMHTEISTKTELLQRTFAP